MIKQLSTKQLSRLVKYTFTFNNRPLERVYKSLDHRLRATTRSADLIASAFRQYRPIARVNRESMRVYASNWSMPAPMLPFAGSSRGKLVTHICTEVYLLWILASDAYSSRVFKDPAIFDRENSMLPNDYASSLFQV